MDAHLSMEERTVPLEEPREWDVSTWLSLESPIGYISIRLNC